MRGVAGSPRLDGGATRWDWSDEAVTHRQVAHPANEARANSFIHEVRLGIAGTRTHAEKGGRRERAGAKIPGLFDSRHAGSISSSPF